MGYSIYGIFVWDIYGTMEYVQYIYVIFIPISP